MTVTMTGRLALETEMSPNPSTIDLADGRVLTYDAYGDPDGLPVLFSHGLSDSRLIRNPDDELTRSLGVRMIAADQPGVGGSTAQRGRRWSIGAETWSNWPTRSNSTGSRSPGTPAAGHTHSRSPLICPTASPAACWHLRSVPFDQDGFAKMLVMRDLKLIVKLRHFHRVIQWAYKADIKKAKQDIGSFVEAMAEDDPSDSPTFLDDPAQREMFEANFTLGMMQDEEGVYEMTMALWDWGFEIEEVLQPFDVFYGDADDIISPEMPEHVAHRLPRGTPHAWPGAGHYGFVDRARWTEFLGALTR
jgi:pimeloyl-ACP methyl ester carboxylesterase